MINKNKIRKSIANLKRVLASASGEDRLLYIREIGWKQLLLKESNFEQHNLPSLGKLCLVLEKQIENESREIDAKLSASENDFKRLALKEAVYEYYMDLPYPPDTIAVDYEGDLTARRDDEDVDKTDVDLAPNKNEIYSRWMDKLSKLIRENKISEAEYDESADRGIPQGGAFEKQLDRYRQEFMNYLWQDYYKYYK